MRVLLACVLSITVSLFSTSAHANEAAELAVHGDRIAQRIQFAHEMLSRAIIAAVWGPKVVRIANEATLTIPEGLVLSSADNAEQFLDEGCFLPHPNLAAVFFDPKLDPFKTFLGTVSWVPAGRVSERNWQKIDPDQMFSALRGDVADQNKLAENCDPPLELQNWRKRPEYDPANHQLSMQLNLRDKNNAKNIQIDIDFLLGKGGYFLIQTENNLDDPEVAENADKQIVENMHFLLGRDYESFDGEIDAAAPEGVDQLIRPAVKISNSSDLYSRLMIDVVKLMVLCSGGLGIFGIFRYAKDYSNKTY